MACHRRSGPRFPSPLTASADAGDSDGRSARTPTEIEGLVEHETADRMAAALARYLEAFPERRAGIAARLEAQDAQEGLGVRYGEERGGERFGP
jgi:hypothetical protein